MTFWSSKGLGIPDSRALLYVVKLACLLGSGQLHFICAVLGGCSVFLASTIVLGSLLELRLLFLQWLPGLSSGTLNPSHGAKPQFSSWSFNPEVFTTTETSSSLMVSPGLSRHRASGVFHDAFPSAVLILMPLNGMWETLTHCQVQLPAWDAVLFPSVP